MKLLDLCCGLGGWSNGFADEGFDCTGVDIKNHGYPYKFIQSDVMDFHTKEKYDVITASPPCTEFSIAKYYAYGTQIEYQGLDLVWACFNIINEVKPQYWIVENVKGISKFLGEPHHIVQYGRTVNYKSAYLYGNFPIPGLFNEQYVSHTDKYGNSDIRRSLIPYPMARAFAKTIKHDIIGNCSRKAIASAQRDNIMSSDTPEDYIRCKLCGKFSIDHERGEWEEHHNE